jgi:hypothetical protein
MKSDGTNTDSPVHQPKEFFDLRFWYLKSPDEEEIAEVANILKKLIHDEKIRANRISWIHFEDVNRLRYIVNKWRSLPAKRKTTNPPGLMLEIPRLFDPSHLQSPHTPPASHSSNSSISDNHMEPNDACQNMDGVLKPRMLPQDDTMSEIGESNLSSENIIESDSPSHSGPIIRDAKRAIPHHTQWLHPSLLLFVTAILFYACAYYL